MFLFQPGTGNKSPISIAGDARGVLCLHGLTGTPFEVRSNPDVIKAYEAGKEMDSMVGKVHFRPEDHQLVRPVIIVRGKKAADMKGKEDYWDVLEVLPGEPLMQKPDAFGCKLGDYT